MRTVVSWVLLVMMLGACGEANDMTTKRVVLLAPFEGRYREVGYQTLYAVQLAFSESSLETTVELVAIDDGGNAELAGERARALYRDERVIAMIVAGFTATEDSVLHNLSDVPVLVAGSWLVDSSVSERVFVNANPLLPDAITLPEHFEVTDLATHPSPYVAGEIALLHQYWDLAGFVSDVEVVSSFVVPDDQFRERYLALNQFAPEPNLIAVAAYETAHLLIESLELNRLSRDGVYDSLLLNGHFENGFNTELPIYFYQYDHDGNLLPIDRVVEEG